MGESVVAFLTVVIFLIGLVVIAWVWSSGYFQNLINIRNERVQALANERYKERELARQRQELELRLKSRALDELDEPENLKVR